MDGRPPGYIPLDGPSLYIKQRCGQGGAGTHPGKYLYSSGVDEVVNIMSLI